MAVVASEATWTKHLFRAMGTTVTSHARCDSPDEAASDLRALFADVERTCSRFDPGSDLMRANAVSDGFHEVSRSCTEIVLAALESYVETGGLFDPRVLDALVSAGYDRTFDRVPIDRPDAAAPPIVHGEWRPEIDRAGRRIKLGPRPIDLGGVGKGWTVDAAARLLTDRTSSFMVNAGGDLALSGDGPFGDGWSVAIEDPRDPTLTIAVLRLTNASCASSSTGRRRWRVRGEERHHLIDPRTGRPAQGGVRSVTVVAPTTVKAETWSKALVIAGADAIGQLSTSRGLAAFWVFDDDQTGMSDEMRPLVTWQRSQP